MDFGGANWTVGRYFDGSAATYYYDGQMDELLVSRSVRYTHRTVATDVYTIPTAPYGLSDACLFAQDSGGNMTKLSPHNEDGDWEYYSENMKTGKKVRINMERMIRDIETLTGNQYIENE